MDAACSKLPQSPEPNPIPEHYVVFDLITLIDMLRCAITDRTLFFPDAPAGREVEKLEQQRKEALIRQAALWAAEKVNLIQLREKDLSASELATIAGEILQIIEEQNSPTRLLINSSLEAAIASRAHGVHLTSNSTLTPDDIREAYAAAGLQRPVVTLSCHTLEEVERAVKNTNPDAILLAPVFEKVAHGEALNIEPTGLRRLREVCHAAAPTPVYALGGVTLQNAPFCLEAGAAGIAGIRLFLDKRVSSLAS
jgi:thiamine-phosphate pyrophosphorylase